MCCSSIGHGGDERALRRPIIERNRCAGGPDRAGACCQPAILDHLALERGDHRCRQGIRRLVGSESKRGQQPHLEGSSRISPGIITCPWGTLSKPRVARASRGHGPTGGLPWPTPSTSPTTSTASQRGGPGGGRGRAGGAAAEMVRPGLPAPGYARSIGTPSERPAVQPVRSV